MASETHQILCPGCGLQFSPTEAMAGEIEKEIEKKFRQKTVAMEQQLKAKEDTLLREKALLEKQKTGIQETVQGLLVKEKATLQAQMREELAKKSQVELQDLQAQIRERDKQVNELAQNELALRKRARELEEKEKQQELEMQRQMDQQRVLLEEELRKRLGTEYQMKNAEKDLQLEGMRKQIEELKRKSEQGSQQTQGEVMELEVERILATQFPKDEIIPVAKGTKGGDTVHSVVAANGQVAGRILYEIKNTKNWSDTWIPKARDDQREAKAEFIVLITSVLPKGAKNISLVDGVWVCDMASFLGLAVALRHHVNEVFFARSAAAGKGEKLDTLYHYMTDIQFRQHIEAIVEAFKGMRSGLDQEKRAMQKIWAAREKCIERVIMSTAGLYGDIQGIIGASLPKIASLELDGGEETLSLPTGELSI